MQAKPPQTPREVIFLGPNGWQTTRPGGDDPTPAPASRRALVAGALLAAAVLGWWFQAEGTVPVAQARPEAAEPRWGPSPFGPAAARAETETREAVVTPPPAPTGPAADARSGVPVSEWAADFDAAKARFDDLRWFRDDPMRLADAARRVQAELPGLLARGDVQPGQALLLEADVLEVLEPDAARRREQFLRWWSDHPLARPASDMPAWRRVETLQREQKVLLEWQSQPSVDRELVDLENQLQALWAPRRQP